MVRISPGHGPPALVGTPTQPLRRRYYGLFRKCKRSFEAAWPTARRPRDARARSAPVLPGLPDPLRTERRRRRSNQVRAWVAGKDPRSCKAEIATDLRL